MKKIIGYSLWGTDLKYLQGAIENLKLQKQFFPSWKCRFYCHSDVELKWLDFIREHGGEVVIIDENISDEPSYKTNQIHKGWFWRFAALTDKDIDYLIVRDVDSRLSLRDLNAVKDWMNSGKEFHIIRDNVMHGVPICAGMWGATKEFINRIDYDSIRSNFNEPHNQLFGGYDQFFLAKCIYPLVKDTACIHDDWDRYKEGARKIPHLRNNQDYIGQPIEIK